MKKDLDIIVFGSLYLTIFSLIYTIIYYGFSGFIFVVIIIGVSNIPSLFAVLILRAIERLIAKPIASIWYILISIIAFYISYLFWNYEAIDPKNIYQLIEEGAHTFVYYSILSHGIAYLIFKTLSYFKNRSNAS